VASPGLFNPPRPKLRPEIRSQQTVPPSSKSVIRKVTRNGSFASVNLTGGIINGTGYWRIIQIRDLMDLITAFSTGDQIRAVPEVMMIQMNFITKPKAPESTTRIPSPIVPFILVAEDGISITTTNSTDVTLEGSIDEAVTGEHIILYCQEVNLLPRSGAYWNGSSTLICEWGEAHIQFDISALVQGLIRSYGIGTAVPIKASVPEVLLGLATRCDGSGVLDTYYSGQILYSLKELRSVSKI
jgi:hypothetical protein